MTEPADDYLDGCGLDFAADPDDDETSHLRPLFPAGPEDLHLAGRWGLLFDTDTTVRVLGELDHEAVLRAVERDGVVVPELTLSCIGSNQGHAWLLDDEAWSEGVIACPTCHEAYSVDFDAILLGQSTPSSRG